MRKTYYNYTYDGGSKIFISPSYDSDISTIIVLVNDVIGNFTQVSPTEIEVTDDIQSGDRVEVFRETYSENRLVDYQDASILSEKTLDKDSNQLFNLIEEGQGGSDKLYADTKLYTDQQDVRTLNSANSYTDRKHTDSINYTDTEIAKVKESTYTDLDIKTKYENNSDTNAFTDNEKTKLRGIEDGANNYTYTLPTDVVQDRTYIKTDNNYTDVEKIKLSNVEDNRNNYTLPTDVVQDSNYVATDNNFTDIYKNQIDTNDADINSVLDAIGNLRSAQGEISFNTPTVIPVVETKIPFNVDVQSTDTSVFELNEAGDEITFKKPGSYNFTSNATIESATNDSVTIYFNLRNSTTDFLIKTETIVVEISNGDKTTIPLNTLVVINEGDEPLTIDINVIADLTGMTLYSFDSILVSMVNLTGSIPTNHNELLGRTEIDSHPISRITGLQTELDSKLESETLTSLSVNRNILTYTDENGTPTDIDLNVYLDDTNLSYIVSGSLNPSTGIATFTRDDASSFDVDMSRLIDGQASGIATDVTNFNNNLSRTDNTIQKALDTLDNINIPIGDMTKTIYDSTNNGVVDNSELVNGLTVETAVPSGAVFTDTTYTNREIKTKYESNANTNEFNDTEKTKLSNIEDNANNYTHPSTHAGTMINIDTTNFNGNLSSFETDVQLRMDKIDDLDLSGTTYTDREIKTKYENNRNTNEFNDTEKTKLSNIEDNANNYTHPRTHDATIISTDTTNFNTNLSRADDTVQKALDTLDELTAGGTGGLGVDYDSTGVRSNSNLTTAMSAITTGYNNTAMGRDALISTTSGKFNTAFGYQSLYLNTIYGENTAIGTEALRELETGRGNTAVGYKSLISLENGNNNVAIGQNTGLNRVVMDNSTLIGGNAGYSLKGSYNVGVGRLRLYSSPSSTVDSTYNVAIGYQSQFRNETGGYNTTLGSQTLFENKSGINNTAIGFQSLFSNTASDNTAIGYQSLYSNTTGVSNIAFGSNSLYTNTIGNGNAAIGENALYDNIEGNDNFALGIGRLENNTTASTNVAIGNYTLNLNTTGRRNVAISYKSLNSNTTGTDNMAQGYRAGFSNTTGTRNRYIGSYSGYFNNGDESTGIGYGRLRYMTDGTDATLVTNSTAIGNFARVSGDNQVQLGNSATTTYVYGTVQNRSDERDKRDIQDTSLGLEFINKLRPVEYKWDMREDYLEEVEKTIYNTEEVTEEDEYGNTITRDVTTESTEIEIITNERDGSKKRSRFHQGLIAQEVKKTIDELGVDFGGYQDHSIGGGADVKSLGYDEFISPLIKAVQELSRKVEEQQKEINTLKGL